ncbi:MAG: hypothetical protein NZ872_00935 [Archaeoglobaceae archaeon]|nr:hypothetical protein [Archaeoglobaceae archaeon]MDW8127763.1 hypothetical protein [Archaeoglobaceae archaeon]
MELEIPEKILFETNVYTIENDLKAITGKVRITEDRILFESKNDIKIVYIPGVRTIRIHKEEHWGFLTAGAIFLMTSTTLYSLALGINSFFSAIIFFVIPTAMLGIGLLLVYWWWLTRSNVLILSMDFGKDVRIRSSNLKDLIEIANAIELVRIGAVKRLPKKFEEAKTLSYL